jgi:hypothetical protein
MVTVRSADVTLVPAHLNPKPLLHRHRVILFLQGHNLQERRLRDLDRKAMLPPDITHLRMHHPEMHLQHLFQVA